MSRIRGIEAIGHKDVPTAPAPRRSANNTASIKKKNEDLSKEDAEKEQMRSLCAALPALDELLELRRKIGEGTFSTVYLGYPRAQRALPAARRRWCAVKHLVPTAHPARVEHELRCLRDIGGKDNVIGVDLCLRHLDTIVFIMPYLPHKKFSEYVGAMDARELREYLRALLRALRRVHAFGVIHRDVKPSNFLYDRENRRYLLVDFGLAQRITCAPGEAGAGAGAAGGGTRVSLRAAAPAQHASLKRPREQDASLPAPPAKRLALGLAMAGTAGTPAGGAGGAGEGPGTPAGGAEEGSGPPAGGAGEGPGTPAGEGPGTPAGGAEEGSGPPAGGAGEGPGTPAGEGPGTPAGGAEESSGPPAGGAGEGPGTPAGGAEEGPGAAAGEGPGTPAGDAEEGSGPPAGGAGQGPGTPAGGAEEAPGTAAGEGPGTPAGDAEEGSGPPAGGAGEGPGTPAGGAEEGPGTPPGGAEEGPGTPAGGAGEGPGTPEGVAPADGQQLPKACLCWGAGAVCGGCAGRGAARACRAGTGGFRPPEVLLKCPRQGTAVDMWAVGVVASSVLSGRYPFLRAGDDPAALAELAGLLGSAPLQRAAAALGRRLLLSRERPGLCLRKLCARLRGPAPAPGSGPGPAPGHGPAPGPAPAPGSGPGPAPGHGPAPGPACPHCRVPQPQCLCLDPDTPPESFTPGRVVAGFPDSAFALVARLLAPDPRLRITAEQALQHPFLTTTD